MSKRINYIDWLKVFGILLVIEGHLPIWGGVKSVIYCFHMPLFFFISGLLYKPKGFYETIIKSVKSIIIPFLIYAIFNYLILYMGKIDYNVIVSILLGDFDSFHNALGPLWFLISLFSIRVANSLFVKRELLLAVISIIVFLAVCNIDSRDYFQYKTTLMMLPFFNIGYLFKERYVEHVNRYIKDASIYSYAFLIFVSSILFFTLYWLNNNDETGMIVVLRNQYGINFGLFVLDGLLAICVVLMFFIRFFDFENPYVRSISNGTMLIFATHYLLISFIRHFVKADAFVYFVIAIILLLMYIYPIRLCEKYAKILLGK